MAKIPTIVQYIAKCFKLLFFTRAIIQVQANKPAINAAIKPLDRTSISFDSVNKVPSIQSFAIFPKIRGITIKKEKRADFERSTPSKTAVAIVAPDLEIPGSIAKACAIPIRIACI